MSRTSENNSFVCENCGESILPLSNGSYRNHCPFCLYSKHVDIKPGDRLSMCKGIMRPIGIKNSSKKGLQIIHQCLKCGEKKVNIIAEGSQQPDSIEEIINVMRLKTYIK